VAGARFELRRPERERGRFASTPSSSVMARQSSPRRSGYSVVQRPPTRFRAVPDEGTSAVRGAMVHRRGVPTQIELPDRQVGRDPASRCLTWPCVALGCNTVCLTGPGTSLPGLGLLQGTECL
jgi:hypothetical protein